MSLLPPDHAAVRAAERQEQCAIGQLHRHGRKLDLLRLIEDVAIVPHRHLPITHAVLQQLQQPGDQRGIREYPRKVRTFTPLQEKRACLAERSFRLIDDLFPVHIRQHAEDQCVYRIEPTLLKRDVFPQFSIIQYSLHKHLPL